MTNETRQKKSYFNFYQAKKNFPFTSCAFVILLILELSIFVRYVKESKF